MRRLKIRVTCDKFLNTTEFHQNVKLIWNSHVSSQTFWFCVYAERACSSQCDQWLVLCFINSTQYSHLIGHLCPLSLLPCVCCVEWKLCTLVLFLTVSETNFSNFASYGNIVVSCSVAEKNDHEMASSTLGKTMPGMQNHWSYSKLDWTAVWQGD